MLSSRLNKSILAFLLLWPSLAAVNAADSAAGLTDAALQQVHAETEKHGDALFRMQAGKPFVPGTIIKDWNKRGDFTRIYNLSVVLFATRALYLNEQVETADKALREMCQYHLDRPQTLLEVHSFPGMLRPLVQLSQLYGPNGSRTKNLLSAETNEVILKTMWAWASVKSRLAEAEIDRKSTRLNSSHANISYAVFCLKKKIKIRSKGRMIELFKQPTIDMIAKCKNF